jgi:hypothetical protein
VLTQNILGTHYSTEPDKVLETLYLELLFQYSRMFFQIQISHSRFYIQNLWWLITSLIPAFRRLKQKEIRSRPKLPIKQASQKKQNNKKKNPQPPATCLVIISFSDSEPLTCHNHSRDKQM